MTRLLVYSVAATVLLVLINPASSFSSPFQRVFESNYLYPRFRARPDDMPRIETSSLRFKWYEKARPSEVQPSADFLENGMRARVSHWRKRTQKAAGSFLATTLLAFSLRNPAFAGTSGGRCGGSFGPSGRASTGTSSMRSSPMRSCGSSSSRRYYRPPLYSRGYSSTRMYSGRPIAATKASPADMVVMTGAGALIVYGLVSTKRGPLAPQNSALGPGVSVASITVALNVPNRDDRKNVLYRVRRLSESAKTYERRGIQQLVSDVALELLRQERSVMSAKTVYHHFATVNEAQREFNRLSVQSRSKFDKETVNRFGETDLIESPDSNGDEEDLSTATAAVVTLSLSIEGDKTKLPRITTRDDLTTALARIASDSLVDDCLLAGEVLWAPESRTDKLEKEDVVVDYPDLYPL